MMMLAFLVSFAAAADKSAGPPDPYPDWLVKKNTRIGVNKEREYCDLEAADLWEEKHPGQEHSCRPQKRCPEDFPGDTICGVEEKPDPTDKEKEEKELVALRRWRTGAEKHTPPDEYKKLNDFMTKCVEKDGKIFEKCKSEMDYKFAKATTPFDWVAGKISELAFKALKEVAAVIGEAVVWLLQQFASFFDHASRINLKQTGITRPTEIMMGVSALVAAFLLLIQFGKVGISQQGGPLATAITGLAKWGFITGTYWLCTQTALSWCDTFSTSMIEMTVEDGSEDAKKAMEVQLGKLFLGMVGGTGAGGGGAALVGNGGIVAHSVGAVIVLGILSILAIGMLWMEMLIRQAAIMVLVTMMPIALAGQMQDSTKEWWPKARNALIALILMKPVIVICFSIGFSAMGNSTGIQNILVGLVIFIISGFAWPAIAKFITFTTVGAGAAMASGMISSLGSSASSMFGGNQPALAGPGTVGGGSSYTRALEGDNMATAGFGSGGGGNAGSGNTGGQGGGFWKGGVGKAGSKGTGGAGVGTQVGAAVGLGVQLAALGKDTVESGFASAAAHAGLDQGGQGGGRHVVVPPRTGGGGGGGESAPPASGSLRTESEPPPPAVTAQSTPPASPRPESTPPPSQTATAPAQGGDA
ncbi:MULTISPECIES: hypothetical protein [Streptomyces]|uniref:hypothetical protein n=1 Tax=Streptomyces TaxID=1883 RepID=UPI00163D28E0|nr:MULTISPECIES: hypothetical protein [Streptomyces]MBC2878437.1 hypothetical protein [Streptomyces sp. TYQ1024]